MAKRTITQNQAIPMNTTPSGASACHSYLDGFSSRNASGRSRLRSANRRLVYAASSHDRQSHRGDNSKRLHDLPRWENPSGHFLTLSESQAGLNRLSQAAPWRPGIPPQDREDREQCPPQRVGSLMRDNCKNDADQDADQRDEISYAKGHFSPPFLKSAPYRNGGWESKCLDVSLAGSVLRKHDRAISLVCPLPLELRSFMRVLRCWTPASDLPDAVADCCHVGEAHPGKSFEQSGRSELGGDFLVLHGSQLADTRGCNGGRFETLQRYFVSLFVEPWRTSGDQRLAEALSP
jgi:hypothetical protein